MQLAYIEKLRTLLDKVRFLGFLEKLEAVPTLGPHSRGTAASSWGSGPRRLPSPAVWPSPWNLRPPCLLMGREASLAQAVKTSSW